MLGVNLPMSSLWRLGALLQLSMRRDLIGYGRAKTEQPFIMPAQRFSPPRAFRRFG
jgi:hypothetical protein